MGEGQAPHPARAAPARRPRRRVAHGRDLGERVGETVGLRVRLQSLVSPRTRVEVVTEGVFAHGGVDDPALEGVGAVLFDEFHERSLDADLGLALALDAQGALREDLRLVVMSATLDGARVARLMGEAALIESGGEAFPVETRYLGRDPAARTESQVVGATLRGARRGDGVDPRFPARPGAKSRASPRSLRPESGRPDVDIAPLYGALDCARAGLRHRPGAGRGGARSCSRPRSPRRRSQFEGVRVVVDSGLMRVPRL